MADLKKKLEMQIEVLIAQKKVLSQNLARGQQVTNATAEGAFMLAENTQTLADQIKSIDETTSALITAHGSLAWKYGTPLQMASTKEYSKLQHDEKEDLQGLAMTQKVNRAMFEAKGANNGTIPPWRADDPSSWIFY
eukprot:526497-Pyramimonas_sp.AAC.1